MVTPKDCPAGFYCPNGTKTARENPCPVGTFSNTTRVDYISECRLCPEGFYCITQPTAKCSPGFYCILGASTPTPNATEPHWGPCPQGTYCDEGWGWPTPCPMGTYGNRDRLPGLSHCTIFPPGEFCATSGLYARMDPVWPDFTAPTAPRRPVRSARVTAMNVQLVTTVQRTATSPHPALPAPTTPRQGAPTTRPVCPVLQEPTVTRPV